MSSFHWMQTYIVACALPVFPKTAALPLFSFHHFLQFTKTPFSLKTLSLPLSLPWKYNYPFLTLKRKRAKKIYGEEEKFKSEQCACMDKEAVDEGEDLPFNNLFVDFFSGIKASGERSQPLFRCLWTHTCCWDCNFDL